MPISRAAWRCPRLARDGARCQGPGTCGWGRPSSASGAPGPGRWAEQIQPSSLVARVLQEPSEQRRRVVQGSRVGSPARPVHPTAPFHVSPEGPPKTCQNTGSSGPPYRWEAWGQRGQGLAAPSHTLEARLQTPEGVAGEARTRGGPAVSAAHGVFQLPLPRDTGSLGTWQAPRSWSSGAGRRCGGRWPCCECRMRAINYSLPQPAREPVHNGGPRPQTGPGANEWPGSLNNSCGD